MRYKMRIFIILFLTLLSGSLIHAEEIEGSWFGKLNLGSQSLRLSFHIKKVDNELQATMDSPNQGAKGIPVSNISYRQPTLNIKLSALNASYSGILKDTLIEGTFVQNGISFPLILTRYTELHKRPQMPRMPFPYHTEEVTFHNVKANIDLAGTLSFPAQGNNFPAVVLISGSGPQNRDEELMGHKPFLVLSDYLTRRGIAVLRYDDRGTAASKGDFKTATTADFKTDGQAAFQFLQQRQEIDKKRIGLIGHSEGGSIVFMAAEEMPEIAFVVSMAGTAMRGDSVLLLQNRSLFEKHLPIDQLNNYMSALQSVFETKDEMYKLPALQKENVFKEKIQSLKSYQSLMPTWQDNLKEVSNLIDSPWFHFFLSYNPQEAIRNTHCPILAINGVKDTQVLPANLNLIKEATIKGKNSSVKTVAYEGLNHLFQHCTTGMPQEYAEIEETISPEVLKDIADWILQTVK